MRTKTNYLVLGILGLALLTLTVNTSANSGPGNCSNENYGVQVNTYIIAKCDGDNYENVQFCNQKTGAGAGAGSGAVGVGPDSDPSSAAAASGTAGTNCHYEQGNEESSTEFVELPT
ncbi:MAG: hypothetical protein WC876_02790 [Candidatus Thermoplasmatota archaeon]|jgi:hypothetical protein